MTTTTINHERYGERQEFATVEEAQQAIRDCGPEFAGVKLYDDGGRVYNERGERVGSVSSDHPDGCSCGSPDCPQWQAAQEQI
jgi:hypothetical protein